MLAVATKVVVHIYDRARVMVTGLSNESNCIFNKGIGTPVSEEKPENQEDEDFAFLSSLFTYCMANFS